MDQKVIQLNSLFAVRQLGVKSFKIVPKFSWVFVYLCGGFERPEFRVNENRPFIFRVFKRLMNKKRALMAS